MVHLQKAGSDRITGDIATIEYGPSSGWDWWFSIRSGLMYRDGMIKYNNKVFFNNRQPLVNVRVLKGEHPARSFRSRNEGSWLH